MALYPCLTVVLLVMVPHSFSASQMDQLSWVTTSRCRASCVEEYLSWAQEDPASVSENDCIEDYGGCFTCWRMCELLVADPPRWSYWCQKDMPESQCSSGCQTACEFITNTETVYYGEKMFEPEKPEVNFHNDSALTFSVQNPLPRGHISWGVVFLVYYKHATRTQWTFFLSTFELYFPIYGQYKKYTNLVFQIKTVSEDGVIALGEVEIEQLLSQTSGTDSYTSSTSVPKQESTSRTPLAYTSEQVTIMELSSTSTVDSTLSELELTSSLTFILQSSDLPSTMNEVQHTGKDSLTTTVPNSLHDSLTAIDIASITIICCNLTILAFAFIFFYIYMRKRSLSADPSSSPNSSQQSRLDLTDLEKAVAVATLDWQNCRPLVTSSTVTSLVEECGKKHSCDEHVVTSGSSLNLSRAVDSRYCLDSWSDEVVSPQYSELLGYTASRKEEIQSVSEDVLSLT